MLCDHGRMDPRRHTPDGDPTAGRELRDPFDEPERTAPATPQAKPDDTPDTDHVEAAGDIFREGGNLLGSATDLSVTVAEELVDVTGYVGETLVNVGTTIVTDAAEAVADAVGVWENATSSGDDDRGNDEDEPGGGQQSDDGSSITELGQGIGVGDTAGDDPLVDPGRLVDADPLDLNGGVADRIGPGDLDPVGPDDIDDAI